MSTHEPEALYMPTSSPARLGAVHSLGHDRLEALLCELVASLDPCHEIPGTGRRYEGVDLGDALAEHVEAWLIAWPVRTGLGMHDHQGSEAVLAVVRSSLRERYLDGPGISQRWLQPGRIERLPSDHVHEVVNTSDVEALSIHLYSPPLANRDFRTDAALEFVLAPHGTRYC